MRFALTIFLCLSLAVPVSGQSNPGEQSSPEPLAKLSAEAQEVAQGEKENVSVGPEDCPKLEFEVL